MTPDELAHLRRARDHKDRDYARPLDAEALTAMVAKGGMNGFVFTTDDVDKTFEQIRASGAEVLQEPIDQRYGVRDCSFCDPSGNQLRFSQTMAG